MCVWRPWGGQLLSWRNTRASAGEKIWKWGWRGGLGQATLGHPGCLLYSVPGRARRALFSVPLRPAILGGVFFPLFYYSVTFFDCGHSLIFNKSLFDKEQLTLRLSDSNCTLNLLHNINQIPQIPVHPSISSILGLKVWEKFPVSAKSICSSKANCACSIQPTFQKLSLGGPGTCLVLNEM